MLLCHQQDTENNRIWLLRLRHKSHVPFTLFSLGSLVLEETRYPVMRMFNHPLGEVHTVKHYDLLTTNSIIYKCCECAILEGDPPALVRPSDDWGSASIWETLSQNHWEKLTKRWGMFFTYEEIRSLVFLETQLSWCVWFFSMYNREVATKKCFCALKIWGKWNNNWRLMMDLFVGDKTVCGRDRQILQHTPIRRQKTLVSCWSLPVRMRPSDVGPAGLPRGREIHIWM